MLFAHDYSKYLPKDGAFDMDRFRLLLLVECGPLAIRASQKNDFRDVPGLVKQAKRELTAAGVPVTKAKVKAEVRRILVERHNKRAAELVDRIKAKSVGQVAANAKRR